jgi:hypothetical protein
MVKLIRNGKGRKKNHEEWEMKKNKLRKKK